MRAPACARGASARPPPPCVRRGWCASTGHASTREGARRVTGGRNANAHGGPSSRLSSVVSAYVAGAALVARAGVGRFTPGGMKREASCQPVPLVSYDAGYGSVMLAAVHSSRVAQCVRPYESYHRMDGSCRHREWRGWSTGAHSWVDIDSSRRQSPDGTKLVVHNIVVMRYVSTYVVCTVQLSMSAPAHPPHQGGRRVGQRGKRHPLFVRQASGRGWSVPCPPEVWSNPECTVCDWLTGNVNFHRSPCRFIERRDAAQAGQPSNWAHGS